MSTRMARPFIYATSGRARKRLIRRLASLRSGLSIVYGSDLNAGNQGWQAITKVKGKMIFPWNESSTYIKEPPFLAAEFRVSRLCPVIGPRARRFGDFGYDRSHQSYWQHPGKLARGSVSAEARREAERFQQLRRAPNEP